MKKGLIFLLFLNLVSCYHETKNVLPDEIIINKVIVQVLDSIPYVHKNNDIKIPFCSKIFSFVLEPEKVYKIPPPPGAYGMIDLKQFINSNENIDSTGIKIFSQKDLDYFLYQINEQTYKEINASDFSQFYLMDYSKIVKDTIDHFKINLPLFSKDLNLVYVELEHHYRGAWGHAFIYKKVNKKWILFKEWTLWLS